MNSNRRSFLQTSLGLGAATLVPARSWDRILGANERLNIGAIGVGGRGAGDLAAVASENIVAICDVDEGNLNRAAELHPTAKKYFDYRELLERSDLDAVVIATPDHHHAPAAVRALRRDLHVYCEKPLTHTVEEARLLTQLSTERKLVTQMGTQNHEHPGYLRLVELLRANIVGPIREVHVITDRPGGFWKQGLELPTGKPEVPAGLNWELWLGPANERDYQPEYAPFRWRGWWDFGCGAIGDMAIHLMDPAFWGLELGGPVTVSSKGPPLNAHCGPTWMETKFEFSERGEFPAVTLFWYEGEAKPAANIAAELPMNGSLFIGDKGRIAIQHDGSPVLLPKATFADIELPESSLPASPGHHVQWIEACKGNGTTSSPFSYAGPFTEYVLLGNVAYRSGQAITFEPGKMSTNVADANRFLTKSYRKGWDIR